MDLKKYTAEDIPLLEFDPDKTALIEPSFRYGNETPPEFCVLPMYEALIKNLESRGKLEKIAALCSLLVSLDIYKLNFDGKSVLVVYPGLTAPFAVGMFERLISLGCRKFVACGACGVLKPELKNGVVIIPDSALRDEGTSYHYLPPSRTVEMNPEVVNILEAVLKKHHINYEIGKTWTTDAFYRETKGKIAKRKEEGCIAVEMECSAFLAVSKFRSVLFGQYLTASDDVSGDEWDRTVDHSMSVQEKLFWLSVEACLSL